MPGGNLGGGAVVEMGAAFSEITWLDRESGRVRAGVGAVAADLAQTAREEGFFLPFLPSSSSWCRVGGMVANNAAGARSFRYGAAAHFVEVIEGIFAWGEPFRVGKGLPIPDTFGSLAASLRTSPAADIHSWPDLRKNSSGYALNRFLVDDDGAQLLVGSEGTLAFLTHIEFRLPRTPAFRGLAILPARSSSEVQEIALHAARMGTESCEFLGRRFLEISGIEADSEVGEVAKGAYGLLLLEVAAETAGEVEEVLKQVQRLGSQIGGTGISSHHPTVVDRLWQLRHAASPMIAREAGEGRISTQFIEDSVVPPRHLAAYLDGIAEILARAAFDSVVFGHAGDANIHVNPLLDLHSPDWRERTLQVMEETVGLVRSLGGTLTGEHGDGRIRAPYLPRIWDPSIVRGFQEVKRTLDSRGILNPGVILPLPGQDPFEGFTPRPRSHPPFSTPI
jgi:FAD/FMN-containing dehydrogenase